MSSPAYLAATVGLNHRLRAFGVLIAYTATATGEVRTVTALLNGVQESRDLMGGGYEQSLSATLRLPRSAGITPAINDTVQVVSSGAAFRVQTIGDLPTQPEYRLGLTNLSN